MTERDSCCTGKCCERFPINGIRTHQEVFRLLDSDPNYPEYAKIREMLIVIPADEATPYDSYTCKHFDPEAKLCTNYENRPRMCSGYPDNYRCRHCGLVFHRGADECDAEDYKHPSHAHTGGGPACG